MTPAWWSPTGRQFADRADAGRRLASAVAQQFEDGVGLGQVGQDDQLGHGDAEPLVLALPRGGVPVAVPIAVRLGCAFDVVVARKLGLPWQPEFGVGAIAEDGPEVFNDEALRELGLVPADLAAVVGQERAELGRRVLAYRGERPAPAVGGKAVVLVDDGLATGITAVAAARWIRQGGARKLLVAAPVCSRHARAWLEAEADAVLCLHQPRDFGAVGAFYDDFTQVTDAEVITLLSERRDPGRPLPT